jgi:hypothetical protein
MQHSSKKQRVSSRVEESIKTIVCTLSIEGEECRATTEPKIDGASGGIKTDRETM